MIFPWIDIEFQIWQHNYTRGSFGHYSAESKTLQKTPWSSISSNPKSLARDRSRARRGRSCSGDGGHRRQGLRGGKGSGAYGGSVAPRVEGWGDRKDGSRRGPEVAAERSTTTTVFRRSTLAENLRMSFSKTRGRCRCNRLDEYVLE
jgi:hypothetical protein